MNPDSCQLKCQQREQKVYSCSWTDRLDPRRLGRKSKHSLVAASHLSQVNGSVYLLSKIYSLQISKRNNNYWK